MLLPWVFSGGAPGSPAALGTGGWLTMLGWFLVHAFWLVGAAWLLGHTARALLRPTSAELRYLIALLTLGALPGAILLAAFLAVQSSSLVGPQFSLRSLLLPLLPVIWGVGVLAGLSTVLAGVWGTLRLRRGGVTAAPVEACELIEEWCGSLRIPQPVAVAVSPRIRQPLVAGFGNAVVLLPPRVTEWSRSQLEHVLLHELAHVRRQDNLVIFAQRVLESFLWFHPAVWAISRWLDLEREHCCDELVLALLRDPVEYAETLIQLAESAAPPAAPPLVPASSLCEHPHPLQIRIRRILFREESTMLLPSARDVAATLPGGLVWCLIVFGGPAGAQTPVAAKSEPAVPFTAKAVATAEAIEASMLRRVLLDLVGRMPTTTEYTDYLSGRRTLGQIAQRATELNNRTPITDEVNVRLTELARIVKRNWGPEQAIGEPDTAQAGDQVTAWASLSQDGGEEWLICEYAKPIAATAVRVHETYNPGALVRVVILNDKDEEILAWEGEDPTPRDQGKGVSVIPIKPDAPVKRIKLYLDSAAVPGWNEIDAVGLADESEKVHWAVAATSSTTFAQPGGVAIAGAEANWGPEQAAGEPNTPNGGDAVTAWASASVDGQPEWLVCHYAQEQKPEGIVIHETYNPGAVNKITVFDADGTEHLAWEGEDPTPRGQPRGISVFPVKLDFPVKKIKVYIDSPAVPGWNEIDAVGLRDAEGKTAWAQTVEASSTYASLSGGVVTPEPFVPVSMQSLQRLESDVQELKTSVNELKQLREEIRELKQLLKEAKGPAGAKEPGGTQAK